MRNKRSSSTDAVPLGKGCCITYVPLVPTSCPKSYYLSLSKGTPCAATVLVDRYYGR